MEKTSLILLWCLIVCLSGNGTLFSQNFGDVNFDNEINIIDALLVARYYVGLLTTLEAFESADVNADNVINIIDALMIAQFYVGLIAGFPAETQPGPETILPGEPFQIEFGESVEVEGEKITISLVEVRKDSRCPSGWECIEPGTAQIRFQIQEDTAAPVLLDLWNPPHSASSRIVGTCKITCLAIDPYPTNEDPLPQDDYMATLIVEIVSPSPSPTPVPTQASEPRLVPLDKEFQIKYGEQILVNNGRLVLHFISITDSRCPLEVFCIWAGEAVIGLEMDTRNGSLEYHTLKNPPNEPSSVEMWPYIISCLAVDPYPVDINPLPPEVYTATLIVTTQSDPTPSPYPQSTPPGRGEAPFNEEFRIKYGESVVIEGVPSTVSFIRIGDFRCPLGADCIEEGEVSIGLEIQERSVEPLLIYFRNPPISGPTIPHGTYYQYTVLAVDPYPVNGIPISPWDYTATVIVQNWP